MPDTWTFNREKLKNALTEAGAKCEAEPRVLENRDPFWTCHIDLDEIREDGLVGYDIYIHDANDFFLSPISIACFTLIFILGILAGYIWRLISRR